MTRSIAHGHVKAKGFAAKSGKKEMIRDEKENIVEIYFTK